MVLVGAAIHIPVVAVPLHVVADRHQLLLRQNPATNAVGGQEGG